MRGKCWEHCLVRGVWLGLLKTTSLCLTVGRGIKACSSTEQDDEDAVSLAAQWSLSKAHMGISWTQWQNTLNFPRFSFHTRSGSLLWLHSESPTNLDSLWAPNPPERLSMKETTSLKHNTCITKGGFIITAKTCNKRNPWLRCTQIHFVLRLCPEMHTEVGVGSAGHPHVYSCCGQAW